jgi:phosphotriesterase-related protein
MDQRELVGKAQTVLGILDGQSLGKTSCHEHILWDMSTYFQEPATATERGLAHQSVSLDNLWWVRANPNSNLDNQIQTDEQLAIKELLRFKYAGGGTLVELSPLGMARDPVGLAHVARATGLNIVMGCGYYVGQSHPKDMDLKTDGEIAQEIVRDIIEGVGDTGIHAGIIGEIGCSMPLTQNEKKVLRACAMAQRRTGAAINMHPSIDDQSLLEGIKVLHDAGADLTRVAISHVDGFGFSIETRRKVLEMGCYLEFDGFGQSVYHFLYMGRVANADSDIKRINDICQIIDMGYINQILLAQDFCFKCCLATYGGYGYAHILTNLQPFLRAKGVTEQQINTLLVENPRKLLEFVSAKE